MPTEWLGHVDRALSSPHSSGRGSWHMVDAQVKVGSQVNILKCDCQIETEGQGPRKKETDQVCHDQEREVRR